MSQVTLYDQSKDRSMNLASSTTVNIGRGFFEVILRFYFEILQFLFILSCFLVPRQASVPKSWNDHGSRRTDHRKIGELSVN